MFKVGDIVRVIADEERLRSIGLSGKQTGRCGIVKQVSTQPFQPFMELPYRVLIDETDNHYNLAGRDLELVEEEVKEVEAFKVSDKVKVVADEKRLLEIGITRQLTGAIGVVTITNSDSVANTQVDFGPDYEGTWWVHTQDLELVETEETNEAEADEDYDPADGPPEGTPEVKEPVQLDSSKLTVFGACPKPFKHHAIRTFDSGATMTLERFNDLVDYIVEKRIKAVMCAKSAEYAEGTNKLHNFDRAGEMRDITPMEALRGMKLKHEVSIQDMLDGLTKGKTYSRERWEEKFTDNINYQILEWAILARDNGWDV